MVTATCACFPALQQDGTLPSIDHGNVEGVRDLIYLKGLGRQKKHRPWDSGSFVNWARE
jgi:hypothetical protein